jgi:4-hydroxy 2-oxovalerate aldolase
MSERRRVIITDSTLRDGSHAMSHQFTMEQVLDIVKGLDEAGVPFVEISHGDGLGGSSVQYGFSREDERDHIEAAAALAKRSNLAVLLLPGIGTKEDLKEARANGAKMARIATHVTEADISAQHIGLAREMGMETVGFLMMSHMEPPKKIAEQGKLMESYGAQCVYVVDSAGAMTETMARERVRALRDAVQVEVGMHAHNNLGLSVANSIAAVEEGAVRIDGCSCGLGAGAGNTPTEVLVAVLEKMGYDTGIDLYRLMDVAEMIVRPIMPRPQIIDRDGLVLGYAGVYSSFLLHAKRASERFGVEARDILMELGRRRVVGGQEDMIVDVAVELATRQGGKVAGAR